MKFPVIESKEDFDTNFQSEIWLDVAEQICRRHQVSFTELKRANSSDHIVFFVDDSLILKIYRPFRNCFERETKAIEFVSGKLDFATPEIVGMGEFENLKYVLMTQLSGESMTRGDWLKVPEKQQLSFASKLAVGLKQIHSFSAENFENNWAEFVEDRAATFIERQIAHGVNSEVIESLPQFIEENLKLVPKNELTVFMHSDVHFGNLRVSEINGSLEIAGLFDFADSRRGFYEYDFLAVGVLMMQGQREVQREFFKAYGYRETDLDETFRKRLMMLTMLYETADLRRYALRLKPEAVDFSLEELERGIWSFAE
jgi:Ser/Thr protein kinase RdoA (MazF antagonist)